MPIWPYALFCMGNIIYGSSRGVRNKTVDSGKWLFSATAIVTELQNINKTNTYKVGNN